MTEHIWYAAQLLKYDFEYDGQTGAVSDRLEPDCARCSAGFYLLNGKSYSITDQSVD